MVGGVAVVQVGQVGERRRRGVVDGGRGVGAACGRAARAARRGGAQRQALGRGARVVARAVRRRGPARAARQPRQHGPAHGGQEHALELVAEQHVHQEVGRRVDGDQQVGRLHQRVQPLQLRAQEHLRPGRRR